jgi:hypothetical protein
MAFVVAGCSPAPPTSDDAKAELLALHAQVLDAHRRGDVEPWMRAEADEFVSANGGEITFPTAEERRAARTPYLASTSFEVYRDLVTPVVEVSPDGLLGWVIAQVEVRGTRTAADSTTTPVADVWAWIELYRRIDGEWKMVGNVSNRKS